MADPAAAHRQASKLAELLGETIIHHAPWTAQVTEDVRRAGTTKFLEEWEQHSKGMVAPFLREVLDRSDPPPAIRSLFEEAIEPSAALSFALEQIFVYAIAFQAVGAAMTPFLQEVTNKLWTTAMDLGVHVPLSPADIATAVARGLEPGPHATLNVPEWAYEAAAESGTPPEHMNLLASIVGLPPALQELFELYRRGDINEAEVKQGLREGDFRDDWIERTMGLSHAWLTPLDFVRAAVQAQMSYSDAREWAHRTGLKTDTQLPLQTAGTEATPDMFGLAFSIAGRPPGPQELGRMANRGIIPWEGTGADARTFQQGIAESDVKTKWTDELRRLEQYVPPPRQVGTLLEHGAITHEQAVKYWEAGGVPAELANGYAYMAEQQHIGQDKLLAVGEVKQGYIDGILNHQQAKQMLEDLGERRGVADEVLAILDFRREISAINSMVKRVQTLYVGHKLAAADARAGLESLGVSREHATELLTIWDAVRREPIRLPSPENIAKAVKYGTLTEAEALDELGKLGYEPRDAAIVLSAYGEIQVTPLPPVGAGITG